MEDKQYTPFIDSVRNYKPCHEKEQDEQLMYLKNERDCFVKNRDDLRDFVMDGKDQWKVILTENEISQGVWHIANKLNEKFKGKDIILTGILKGCTLFFIELSKLLTVSHSWYFIEASSYKDKQTQNEQVEILSRIVPEKFAGRHVVLVDELFDNGHTINLVKQKIHEMAFVPLDMILTCTLFKKNKNLASNPDLYGFDVPDVWLVGYGLDFRQEKRGWSVLFASPKSDPSLRTIDDMMFDDETNYFLVRLKLIKQIDMIKRVFYQI